MARYVFDIETDGFLDVLTRVHSLVLKNVDTGEVTSCATAPNGETPGGFTEVELGLQILANADEIIGHNIIKFDIPALMKVYPDWKFKGEVFDTLVGTRLIWTDIKGSDAGRIQKGKMPPRMRGRHSLEAWGYRLGNYKGDFEGPWDTWTPTMQEYCEQDVHVTTALYQKIVEKNYSKQALDLEHRFATIIATQERYGFAFDVQKAGLLYGVLAGERDKLEKELTDLFKPWWAYKKFKVPKKTINYKDPMRASLTKDAAYCQIERTVFNPSSRDHIADRLIKLYGWEPVEFTDGKNPKPKVDESVLSKLPYPEAKPLARYFLLDKRIGQLAEGKQALLKVEKHGRIYGSVNTNGAVTGRCTHSHPNVAQVPKVGSLYGQEFRELFIVTPKKRKKLVGIDAAGLELRCLAHFMKPYDGGLYIKAVTEGNSKDGTDVHSVNTKAIGLEPGKLYLIYGKQTKGRDVGKTFIYAFCYGAGDWKIGFIVGKGKAAGKKLKALFLQRTLGISKLIEKVKGAAKQRGFLYGLDGRRLHVRAVYSALNTLLQSAGALIMKQALVLLYDELTARGYILGRHYAFVANVHDEFQIEADEDIANAIGQLAVEAIRKAGEHFQFECPLDGEYKVGENWAETH